MPWITCYTFVSWHSPHHFRSRFYHHPFLEALYSSLLRLFVFSSPPFHRRGGLSGTSLWHIVRPVLLRSSILSPFIYFIPPQQPLSSAFFQTSPLGNLSHFKPYLVQWQLHILIYIFTGSFKKLDAGYPESNEDSCKKNMLMMCYCLIYKSRLVDHQIKYQ